MLYQIQWKNEKGEYEPIDHATTEQDAEFLRREYNLAFGGGCRVIPQFDRRFIDEQ